jgi:hypothetical protein
LPAPGAAWRFCVRVMSYRWVLLLR